MAQTDFTPGPASHLQRDNAELIAAIEPILRFHETGGHEGDGSDAALANARAAIESLSPQPPAETGDDELVARLLDQIERTKHSQACWGYGDSALGKLVRENSDVLLNRLEALSRKGRGE